MNSGLSSTFNRFGNPKLATVEWILLQNVLFEKNRTIGHFQYVQFFESSNAIEKFGPSIW